MLRLYMDVHVKAAITLGVRRRGIDVVMAQEDGSQRLEDAPLLARATELGRVLFSQDDDLLAIARVHQREEGGFSGLIYGIPILCLAHTDHDKLSAMHSMRKAGSPKYIYF
jgi:hypothetical protein